MNTPHPEDTICGATAPGPGGIEDYWICTNPPHNLVWHLYTVREIEP